MAPTTTTTRSCSVTAGYAYILFAENWCEGVPVSSINAAGVITYGVPLTRPQLLAIAIQRFDSAITIANTNGDNNNLYLAQIGLARALMDSSSTQYAAAAAAVADVPESYVYLIGASTNAAVENNGIRNYTFNNAAFSMADKEGTVTPPAVPNGLPFVSANDPRVPSFVTGGLGTNDRTPMVQQQLYTTQASPTPLATGIEAQLIIAENQLVLTPKWYRDSGHTQRAPHDRARAGSTHTSGDSPRTGESAVLRARVLDVPHFSPGGRYAPADPAVRHHPALQLHPGHRIPSRADGHWQPVWDFGQFRDSGPRAGQPQLPRLSEYWCVSRQIAGTLHQMDHGPPRCMRGPVCISDVLPTSQFQRIPLSCARLMFPPVSTHATFDPAGA